MGEILLMLSLSTNQSINETDNAMAKTKWDSKKNNDSHNITLKTND